MMIRAALYISLIVWCVYNCQIVVLVQWLVSSYLTCLYCSLQMSLTAAQPLLGYFGIFARCVAAMLLCLNMNPHFISAQHFLGSGAAGCESQ